MTSPHSPPTPFKLVPESTRKPKFAGMLLQTQIMQTDLGYLLMAQSDKGICYLGYADTADEAMEDLKKRFSKARFVVTEDSKLRRILETIAQHQPYHEALHLHVQGTPFQIAVWQALLEIPLGEESSYQALAHKIGQPKAVRAVGTAVGANPIAVLIPCHRVLRSDGKLGGYRWGLARKKALLESEGLL